MVSYVDERNGLPMPSWDLWEERWGVHAFTVGSVWGGLEAARSFADLFGVAEGIDVPGQKASAMHVFANRPRIETLPKRCKHCKMRQNPERTRGRYECAQSDILSAAVR